MRSNVRLAMALIPSTPVDWRLTMGRPPNSSRPPKSVAYWYTSGTSFTSTVVSAQISMMRGRWCIDLEGSATST